jgi:hypothetical protein
LRPDGQVELERERDGRPVVRVALRDALLGLRPMVFVVGGGLLLDWHDLESGQQLSLMKATLGS